MQNKILIPNEVEYVLTKLEKKGFEAFVVGGCVRDSLIGRKPSDWDVTTNALPAEIKTLFDKTIDTGIKHGTITILIGKMAIEATTYRVDGNYEDNRRPSEVRFSNSLIEDLSRRDFTINAIAYNPGKGLFDPSGGIGDIEEKSIRTVGDAAERFREDALRMLRAIRFSAQLNYDLHPDTMKSICENSSLIANISSERIRDELSDVLMSDNPDRFGLLAGTGLLKHIMPEFCHYPCDMGVVFKALKFIDNDSCLRWAVFISGFSKVCGISAGNGSNTYAASDLAQNLLRRLRFDNKSVHRITTLVKYREVYIEPSLKAVMKSAALTGKDLFEELLKVKKAFIQAGDMATNSLEQRSIDGVFELYQAIVKNNYCLSLEGLALNGRDIMDMGVSDGKTIGVILKMLLDAVLDQPVLNDKKSLVKLSQDILRDFDFISDV